MSEKEFWREKISVLLHDPITKPFDIRGHERISEELSRMVNVESKRGEEDKIASAFDRVPLPGELNAEQIRVSASETYFLHPITGAKLELNIEEGKQKDYIDKIKEKISVLRELNKDDEKFYHALWWELAELIDIAQVLPADTRVPNHSIIDHLDLSAAVKTAIKGSKIDIALLTFSIGPVQQVIAQARKTVDLWAGSYLLSHLIYKAIEKIGVRYGFDTIIFPYLRNNPFVYRTLKRQGVQLLTKPTINEKVASLPNVFLAIVPYAEAKNIIRECKEAVINEWKDLAYKAKREIEKNLTDEENKKQFNEKALQEEFEKQLELFPIINATYIDFPSTPSELDMRMQVLFNDEEYINDFREYVKFLGKIKEEGGYRTNEGSFYKFIYKILTAKLGAIKSVRYFKGYSSNATIYEYGIPDDFGDGTRACFKIEENLDGETKTDFLGVLNATKRMLKNILGDMFDKDMIYESTERIAEKNDVNKERGKLINGYIAVLLMDGDRMGKLISGENALTMDKVLHKKALEKISSELEEYINKTKMFTPAYQRSISRTLGIFSALVRYIVEIEYNGMLVYAGGDDVLALLPADKVLKCANDIRKIYSGKEIDYPIILENGMYTFDKGFVYRNSVPYANMMGNATMSAGIAIINYKSPLKLALELARVAEHKAKDEYRRNAFAVTVVRRSGQMETIGSKWEDNDIDIISKAYEITELAEIVKLSKRSFYKIGSEDLKLLGKENLQKIVDYILRKSDVADKDSYRFETLKKELYYFFDAFCSNEASDEKKAQNCLKHAIDLLLTIRLTRRGDEK